MILPPTQRGRVVMERHVVPAQDGLVGLRQTFRGSDERVVVTHGAFVVAHVEVEKGKLFFFHGAERREAPKEFIMVVPTRQVMRMEFHDAVVRSEGAAGFWSLGVHTPRLLQPGHSVGTWSRSLIEKSCGQAVLTLCDADESAPPAAVACRRRLHSVLAHPAPVRTVARQVGLSPDGMSRLFLRTYGLMPKEYCHRARIFEGVLRILQGRSIVEAARLSGFPDLKRFYEQFRRVLGLTPGAYARVGKRQDGSNPP